MFGIQKMKMLGAVVLMAGLAHAQQRKAPPVPSTAPACPYLYRGDINSRYAFAEASEVALYYASIAVQRYDIFEGKHLGTGNDLVAVMRATKAASEAYRCAELILLPFQKSIDKQLIALGAGEGVQAYQKNVELNDRYLKMLREPDISGGVAGAADQMSTLEVEKEKLWLDLANVAQMSTLGLVDTNYSDPDGHLSGIVLKRSEKEEFLSRLLNDFPELKGHTQSDKWAAPTVIASAYLDFLTQAWACADDRPKH